MRTSLILFIMLTILGCQKYEQISTPKLTGGKWIFTDYEISVISSISDLKILKNDTICLNSFNEQSFLSGNVIMKQNYSQTAEDRRFIRGITTWEFDSNDTQLYCNYLSMPGNVRPNPFWVNMKVYNKSLEIYNTSNGGLTNYTFKTNDVGYPRTLTLLSPPIVTDLYFSNGSRDKAATVVVTLYFMR